MAQPIPECAGEVRAIVQGVHLVHPHAVEVGGMALDGVEQGDRLAVGERHDHIRSRRQVARHVLGRHGIRHQSHPSADQSLVRCRVCNRY